jgi:hypothetical protein
VGPIADRPEDLSPPQRYTLLRFYAFKENLSHEPPDAPLPDAAASGAEYLSLSRSAISPPT